MKKRTFSIGSLRGIYVSVNEEHGNYLLLDGTIGPWPDGGNNPEHYFKTRAAAVKAIAKYNKQFEVKEKPLSLEQQIKAAKALIGKTVECDTIKFTVSKFGVYVGDGQMSHDVKEEAGKKGFCVYVSGNGYSVPFDQTVVVKETIVYLNDKYDAVVSENDVKVGCQSFTHEAILRLAETIKNWK